MKRIGSCGIDDKRSGDGWPSSRTLTGEEDTWGMAPLRNKLHIVVLLCDAIHLPPGTCYFVVIVRLQVSSGLSKLSKHLSSHTRS